MPSFTHSAVGLSRLCGVKRSHTPPVAGFFLRRVPQGVHAGCRTTEGLWKGLAAALPTLRPCMDKILCADQSQNRSRSRCTIRASDWQMPSSTTQNMLSQQFAAAGLFCFASHSRLQTQVPAKYRKCEFPSCGNNIGSLATSTALQLQYRSPSPSLVLRGSMVR